MTTPPVIPQPDALASIDSRSSTSPETLPKPRLGQVTDRQAAPSSERRSRTDSTATSRHGHRSGHSPPDSHVHMFTDTLMRTPSTPSRAGSISRPDSRATSRQHRTPTGASSHPASTSSGAAQAFRDATTVRTSPHLFSATILPPSVHADTGNRTRTPAHSRPHPRLTQAPSVLASTSTPDTTLLASGQRPTLSQTSWVLDSGSNVHITNDKALFHTYTPLYRHRVNGIGQLSAAGEGTVRLAFGIDGIVNTVTLLRVLYLPSSPHNIISLGKLHRAGFTLDFPIGSDDVLIRRNGQRFAHCRNIDDVYALGNVSPIWAASDNNDNEVDYYNRPSTPPDTPQDQGESNPAPATPPAQRPATPPTSNSGLNPHTPVSTAPSTLTPIPSRESTPHPPAPRKEIIGDISERNIVLGPRTSKYAKPGTFAGHAQEESFLDIALTATSASPAANPAQFPSAASLAPIPPQAFSAASFEGECCNSAYHSELRADHSARR